MTRPAASLASCLATAAIAVAYEHSLGCISYTSKGSSPWVHWVRVAVDGAKGDGCRRG